MTASATHCHADVVYDHADVHRAGLDASGSASSARRASPAPSCCASAPGHPDLEVVLATGDTQAGTPVRRSLPEPRRAPTPTWCSAPYDPAALRRPRPRVPRPAPRRAPGASCRTCAAGSAPSSTWRPTSGCRTPPLYPTWYGEEHQPPRAARPSSPTACPSCSATRSVGASLVAAPGCYVTAAALALAPLVRGGLIERDRAWSSTPPRACPVPAGALKADHHLLHRRRGLHRLRAARPPPHARDRAGHRRPGALHPPPRADEPGDPRHLLRPARPARTTTGGAARRHCGRSTRGEPFVVVSAGSPSTKATLGSNTRPPHRPLRRAHRLGGGDLPRSTTWSRAPRARRVQCANLVLGLPETAGLPLVGVYP